MQALGLLTLSEQPHEQTVPILALFQEPMLLEKRLCARKIMGVCTQRVGATTGHLETGPWAFTLRSLCSFGEGCRGWGGGEWGRQVAGQWRGSHRCLACQWSGGGPKPQHNAVEARWVFLKGLVALGGSTHQSGPWDQGRDLPRVSRRTDDVLLAVHNQGGGQDAGQAG